MKVDVTHLTCLRCGHRWIPRGVEVRQCPSRHCHTTLWEVPKPIEKGGPDDRRT